MSKSERAGTRGSRRNQAEGRALVERWRESGLSVREYCRKHALSEQVLRYWLGKLDGDKASSSKPGEFFVVSTLGAGERGARASESEVATSHDQALLIMVPLGGVGHAVEQVLRALTREARQ